MSAPEALPPRTQIAIAVVEHDGRFLIGQRRPGAPLAGCWEFPGGKIEAGETPAAAAARECLEETGLAVRAIGSYPSVEHDYPHGRLLLHFVACRCVDGAGPLPGGYRWVARVELGQFAFPPANTALLALLADASEPH